MSEIDLTILGTTAGVPTKERAHPSIYVSYRDRDQFTFLFDCGEGTQRQIISAGLKMMKIDAVFITHWHGDHCLGLPGLVDTMGFEDRKRPLKVYAPGSGMVRRSIGSSISMGSFPVEAVRVRARGSSAERSLVSERFYIESIPVKHGVPAVAYAFVEKEKLTIDIDKARAAGLPEEGQIYAELKENGTVEVRGRTIELDDVAAIVPGKKLVYSGDTEICDNLESLAAGADLLIQDCTYFHEQGDGKPHMHASLPEVLSMIKRCGVKRTVLTHISRKYKDKGKLLESIRSEEGVELAEDLMAIKV